MLAALLVALVATAATAPAEVEVGGGSALGGRGPPARRRLVEAISLYDCNVWNALYRCESGGSGRTREACSSGIGCDWETGELPGCSPSGVDLATVTELGARLQAANGDGKIQSKSRSCKGVLGETSCNELTTCQWEAQYNRCFSIQAELVREMAEVGCVVDTSNSWVPRESKLETKFLLPGTSRVDILNGMEKYTGGLNLTDDTYWVALGSVGLFGPAISGLFVFSVMVFLVVRTGFLFCGYSLCPGAKFRSPAYDGPRWCTTRRWAGFITVLMAGATVGTLLCFLGGTLFAAGLTDVIDIMVSTGVDLEGNVTIVESALWQASGVLGDAQYNTSAGTLRNATIDAVKSIKENREAMEIYSKYLLVGVQSISGFMLLLLIGSLPGLLNRRWRHVLLGSILLGFFAVLALWVAASVATVAATFTSDLCAAVRVHLETPLYSDLSEWTECKDEGTVVRDWTRLRQGGADVIDLVNSRLVEFATSLGINPDNFRLMCTPYYSTTPAALCPNNTLPTGYEGKACAAYASGLLLGSDVLYPRRPECPYLEVNRIHVNFPNNFESSVAVRV